MEGEMKFALPPDLKPIYADEVFVNVPIKINIEKDDKGTEKIRKTGVVILNFFDNETKFIVAKIIINPLTAKALGKILLDNANKVLEELDKKEISKEMRKQIEESKKQPKKTVSTLTYIG